MDSNLFLLAYREDPVKVKGNHIIIRCPYCGDSIKNPTHAHLYIEYNNDVFWCARCYTGGTTKYLLYTIKDRFDQYYFDALIKSVKLNGYINKRETYNISYNDKKVKLMHKTQNEMDFIKSFYLSEFNLQLNDVSRLPVFLGSKIDLPDYICWLTVSDLIFCRNMKNKRKFKTYQLSENTNNRLTIFSFKKFKLPDLNIYNQNPKIVIAEGLTDLLFYHLNIDHADIYISCNGKYKDDLLIISDLIKRYNSIAIIDRDAYKYEIDYSISIGVKNILIPIDGNDLRSSTQWKLTTIRN